MSEPDLRWDSPLFRVYEPEQLAMGKTRRGTVEPRYPFAWDRCPSCDGGRRSEPGHTCALCFGAGSIKDLVRTLAGNRCLRCGHPYVVGQDAFWEQPETEALSVVTAQEALTLFDAEPTDEPRVKRERPIHWSPCDERCTHEHTAKAPIRVQGELPDGSWGEWRVPYVFEAQQAGRWAARGFPVHAAWRILTVHHATEEKADCRWWNLLSLCQRCHLEVQGKVQMDRVWPHEHSDWFKPYVAGFYAWRYEERYVTRAEAEERMDELLAYERRVG